MTRFLAGALTVGLLWVAYEVWRNPHGHRGGMPLVGVGPVGGAGDGWPGGNAANAAAPSATQLWVPREGGG